MRVVDDDGQQVGVMPIEEALRRAERAGLGLRQSASDDLRFTVEVCGNPSSGCARSEGMDLISSIDTPDDQTVVLHYQQLYVNYLAQFRDGVLPRHSPDVGAVQDFPHWKAGPTSRS